MDKTEALQVLTEVMEDFRREPYRDLIKRIDDDPIVVVERQGAMSVYWWRQWRLWRADDPSAAELYELNFRIEAALSLIGLAIAIVGIWLIRRIGRRRG